MVDERVGVERPHVSLPMGAEGSVRGEGFATEPCFGSPKSKEFFMGNPATAQGIGFIGWHIAIENDITKVHVIEGRIERVY